MTEPPIPPTVFNAMIDRGALIPTTDTNFDINFYVVQKEFPTWLEFMVESSLNEIERWAYLEGYFAYYVLESGLLEWHPTNRRFQK